MTIALPRQRLAAVLGLLGSTHDGEVLAAARQAERIRQRAGMSWQDVLAPAMASERVRQPDPPPAEWRTAVAQCRQRPDLLTDWEVRFLASLMTHTGLSPKQRDILAGILSKVQTAESCDA